jgi:SAM-dependent methyltransferase
MSASTDPTLATYFTNHALGRKFPWRLYHAPIDRELKAFLSGLPQGARVLNVGCGMFLNLPDLPQHVRYTGTDIDPRAVEACAATHAGRGVEFVRSEPLKLPFADGSFDAAYATEVIEHCDRPEDWLRELIRVVKPGGRILLTTPNYGSFSLKLIEATALEVVARAQGFTRKGIHPFPCTAPTIEALIRAVGGSSPHAQVISFGWVIAVTFDVPR